MSPSRYVPGIPWEGVSWPVALVRQPLQPPDSAFLPDLQVLDVKLIPDRASKFTGKPQKMAECLVGDATATIILTARNERGAGGSGGPWMGTDPGSWRTDVVFPSLRSGGEERDVWVVPQTTCHACMARACAWHH